MWFKDRYKDFVFTAEQIQELYPGSKIENDMMINCTVSVHLHYNAVLFNIVTKGHNDILPAVRCDSKVGHIIRFLVDLFDLDGYNEEVKLSEFYNIPIRIIINEGRVLAIGHFLNNNFAFINSGNENSIWGINK